MFQSQPPAPSAFAGRYPASLPRVQAQEDPPLPNTQSSPRLVHVDQDRPLESVVTRSDLNNFPMRIARHVTSYDFSGDVTIRVPGETHRSLLMRCLAEMDQTPQERDFDGFSERYLAATASEVSADIETALNQIKVSAALIIRIDALRISNSHSEDFDSLSRSVFIPLYRYLREMGYSHRDLTE